ncbi:MAG TPA: transcriptional regulator MntR [Terriglobales bacterium]|nr:transcriptional regulator MntR [Terriglobales bacterium]
MNEESRPNPASDLTRVEDYLEVVYGLIQRKGYARAADIAELLEVKPPSVTSMLQRLDRMQLIKYERYRGLALTEKGERMARFTQQKHLTLIKFLRILGVEEKTVKLDAEGIEHHVHRTTINRIERFVNFVDEHPSWLRIFEDTEKN